MHSGAKVATHSGMMIATDSGPRLPPFYRSEATLVFMTQDRADLRSPDAFEGFSSQQPFSRTDSDFPNEKRYKVMKRKVDAAHRLLGRQSSA
jgi:hypothetical protein